MLKSRKKVTTSLQFENYQYRWLENKALERCTEERHYVSISAILREIVQKAMEQEEEIEENEENAKN